MPAYLNIIGQYDTLNATTITLDWGLPMGSGPETIIDGYTISITPSPLSHPTTYVVDSPPWNVTIRFNMEHNITLYATNCAGQSAAIMLQSIEFSRLFTHSNFFYVNFQL